MSFFREHYQRIWLIYTVVVVVLWLRPLPIPFLYPALLVVYVVLSIAWFQLGGFSLSRSKFLCDTCNYSYGEVCSRPEKPNALKCPDYKKR